MRLPSLRSLRTFQIAARCLSFKDAADELFVTASAVSHQIRSLESYLGVALFERKTRSLALTDPGRAYFGYLDGMFTRLEIETEKLKSQYGRAIVRLYLPPFFASEALLPKLSAFQDSHPDNDIRIGSQTSASRKHPEDADLSVLLGEGPWPGLASYRLFAHRVVPACAPSLLAAHKFEHFDDLNGQTLIVHEGRHDAWDRWAQALGKAVLKPKRLIRLDSMSAVARAAEKGLGIALVSWPMGAPWFESGGLTRLFNTEVETGDAFYLVHRPDEADRQEVAELKQWIVEEFKEDG